MKTDPEMVRIASLATHLRGVPLASSIWALIAGLMRSGMDLSTFGTEEDIATAIQERLKG